MLATKSRCFQFYITKKSVFPFSLLKRVGFGFIAQKTCFGLFALILGCFQCYCTKKRSSSSMQGVTLIFTRFYSNNGFAFFWLSYAVSASSFWGQPCSLFPWPNYTLDALYYWKTCYGLFAVKLFPAILHRKNVFCLFALSHFDFYVILLKTNVSVYFRVSYAVFRIHVWRNSLYLFSYINCAVNPLSYRKHVLGFWQLQWKLRALAHKKQQFGFSLQNTLL